MNKKCTNCLKRTRCPYKKNKKYFCSKECKQNYFDNDIKTLKKELQIEFNRMITENQPCAVCGKRFGKMDCSHILSRGSADNLRFDILNVLPMCSRCHRWFWHENPLQATDWFASRYPERYRYLMFAKNIIRGWTSDELHKIREAIKNKDYQSLIRFKDEWLKSKD